MAYRIHETQHQNVDGTWETRREPIYYESEEEMRERLRRASLDNNPHIQSIDGINNPHLQSYAPPTGVETEEERLYRERKEAQDKYSEYLGTLHYPNIPPKTHSQSNNQPIATGQTSQFGKEIYTDQQTGEAFSERSQTINIDGQWVNVPTVFANGVTINNEEVLKAAVINGVINPTSVHESLQEALIEAETRSGAIEPTPKYVPGQERFPSEDTQGTLLNPVAWWDNPNELPNEFVAHDDSGTIKSVSEFPSQPQEGLLADVQENKYWEMKNPTPWQDNPNLIEHRQNAGMENYQNLINSDQSPRVSSQMSHATMPQNEGGLLFNESGEKYTQDNPFKEQYHPIENKYWGRDPFTHSYPEMSVNRPWYHTIETDEEAMDLVDFTMGDIGYGKLSNEQYIDWRENKPKWRATDEKSQRIKADNITDDFGQVLPQADFYGNQLSVEGRHDLYQDQTDASNALLNMQEFSRDDDVSEPDVVGGLLGQNTDSNEADNTFSINLNEVPSLVKEKISHWWDNTNFVKSFSGWKSSEELDKESREINRGKPDFWHDNNVRNQQLDTMLMMGKEIGEDAFKGTLGGILGDWYGNLSKEADGDKQKYSGNEDISGLMRQNFGQNFAEIVKGGVDMVMSPVQTADAIASVVSGAVQHALPDGVAWNEESKKMASAIADIYVERYTSFEGFKKALAENPAEIISELTGFGLITKAMATKVAQKLNDPQFLDKIDATVRNNPGLFPKLDSSLSKVDDGLLHTINKGKTKEMRDIHPSFWQRKSDEQGLMDLTTETGNHQLIGVPETSIVDHEGKPFVLTMADRSEGGKILYEVNGVKLKRPVPLYGGQNYMLDALNYLQGNVWGSAKHANSTLLNKAKILKQKSGGENPLLFPWAMKGKAVDFSHQTVDLMISYADTVMSRADKLLLNKKIKEILPSWKGINSPKVEELIKKTTGGERKALIHMLDRDFRNKGGISSPEARVAVSDVNQLNVKPTKLMNVAELDMQRNAKSNHPTYEEALKGEPVGILSEDLGAFDILKDEDFNILRGKNVDPQNVTDNDMYNLRLGITGGILDDKLLRSLDNKGLLNNNAKVAIPVGGLLSEESENLNQQVKTKALPNVRNNNLGNIKNIKANNWDGQTNYGSKETFAVFDTPELGVRALVKVVNANLKATNSYETYVNRYASEPKEKAYYNKHGKLMPHLQNYAKILMKSQGAKAITDKPTNIDMFEWIKATAVAEGSQDSLLYFTDKVIKDGINLLKSTKTP